MLATVVIPIYKMPSVLEERSLAQACRMLADYPIVIVKPVSFDVTPLQEQYPCLKAESFADDYFSSIGGYNRLMLSAEFYERFLDSEYILIHQLDAYVFSSDLLGWCTCGYDYVGAPWLQKPVYRLPLIRQYMQVVHQRKLRKGKPSKQSLYNKVGNGGLSLRRVRSHHQAVTAHRDRIAYFLAQPRSHFYNEDVFFATEVPEFCYPDARDALDFAFDKYPAYCYRLTGGRLPFGCHSWYKRKMKAFWKPIIGF